MLSRRSGDEDIICLVKASGLETAKVGADGLLSVST